jgi:SAM-dependent methyltransferase
VTIDGGLPDTRASWTANAPAWTELTRAGYDVHRDLVNTPAFLARLPPLDGRRCLDLGCGEGHNTRLLTDRGADVIVALDIVEVFVRAAVAADPGSRIRHLVADGLALPFRAASFDVVTAFMSLMDVADPERTLAEIARVLRPGGVCQFSVLHPLLSSSGRRWVADGSGSPRALVVGDYFREGPVSDTWTFGAAPPEVRQRYRPFEVTYAHRTVSGWLNAVTAAGLSVRVVDEPCADEATAARHPKVADTRLAPCFLLVQADRR